jgi:hypothetical protein
MYQQIRALLGLGHRVERQRGHPSHELLVCLKFHVVELLARRPATVDIPGLGIERILANDGIELADFEEFSTPPSNSKLSPKVVTSRNAAEQTAESPQAFQLFEINNQLKVQLA